MKLENMSEFNFNSSVCTSIEQSERLLALGLKKETTDMVYEPHYINGVLKDYFEPKILEKKVLEYMLMDEAFKDYIPAWSLHRLIETIQNVCPKVILIYHRVDVGSNVKRIAYSFDVCDNLFDNIIDCIEWLIKEGYFNKEYLV